MFNEVKFFPFRSDAYEILILDHEYLNAKLFFNLPTLFFKTQEVLCACVLLWVSDPLFVLIKR